MQFAFQGVPGAYSELAGKGLFGRAARSLPQEDFEGIFQAVRRRRADRGVIPVENSLAGSIHQNYDLLVQHGLRVIGETYVHVRHALLAPPGTRLKDLRRVRSHPQALAQCSGFFAAHPAIRPEVWFDTAGAAQSLRGERPGEVAALASEYAGKLYGLEILRRNLQNRAENYTRFLAIARSAPRTSGRGPRKTSITFIPRRNAAGALVRILGLFAGRGIDLTKVESRPDPEKPFDYRFYLDLAGGADEAPVRAALQELRKETADLRVLGSYARAEFPPREKKSAPRRAPRARRPK